MKQLRVSHLSCSNVPSTGIVHFKLYSQFFLNFFPQVEAEVVRLEQLKASKLKELVLRKKAELEEIRRRTHLVAEADYEPEFSIDVVEAGKKMILVSDDIFHKFLFSLPIL